MMRVLKWIGITILVIVGLLVMSLRKPITIEQYCELDPVTCLEAARKGLTK